MRKLSFWLGWLLVVSAGCGAQSMQPRPFDLVDVTRQALSNRSRLLLPQIKAAFEARDLVRFRDLTARWFVFQGPWGDRIAADQGELQEYANREWAGLMRDLYKPRWQRYFASLECALETQTAPEPIDWFAIDEAWTRQRNAYPTMPAGDARAVAERAWAQLHYEPRPRGDVP